MARHRGHKPLPKGHIAKKSGERAAHGDHADMVAKTSYGTHQTRAIHHTTRMADGRDYAFDKNDKLIGEVRIGGDGKIVLDDQHNFKPGFASNRNESINVHSPDYWANRDDRELPNSPGTFDPRGTAMGGYNPRK